MKLKYILGSLLSAVLFVGCSDDKTIGTYGNLSEDDTFVVLSADGGDATITINAVGEWAFDEIFSTTKTVDGQKVTTHHPLPTWLTASAVSGSGNTQVTFHADATNGGREAELRLTIDGKKQFVKVRQGSLEASPSSCKEVIDGPDGKTYRVTGTVTAIANTTYGNWYLDDGTGQVYIYGTLDANGGTKNFTSLGIEVGDVVTVEGPKTTYNGTVELVDVTVVKIVKSLIKVVTAEVTMPKEGGNFDVKVAFKGNGANLSIPAEAQSWLKLSSSEFIAGVKTIYDTAAPADTTVFHFAADANEAEGRQTTLEFSSSNASSSSTVSYTVKQEANILPHGQNPDDPFTVAEAIAQCQKIGTTSDGVIYFAKGKISSISSIDTGTYGNATFNISDDGTDNNALTCYRSYSLDNAKFTSADEIAVGDEVVITGKLVNYKGETPEFSGNVYIYKLKKGGSPAGADGSTIISVADFNAAPVDNNVWYQLTGTVNNLKDGDIYGNFDLEDATGSVYVYGVLSEKGGAKKQFQELVTAYGIKNGSTITIVGTRGEYKGKIEVMNAYFISVK